MGRRHPPGGDLEFCLGPDARQADRIACVLVLAHRLLGAELGDAPVARRADHLPRWLMPAVLKQWEKPSPMQHPPASHGRPLSTYGWDLPSLFRAVRCRWPDPIAATIQTGAPFNDLPRFPFQLWDFSRHAGRFLRRIPGLVAGRD